MDHQGRGTSRREAPRDAGTVTLPLPATARDRILAADALHDGPMQQLAYFGYALDAIDRRLVSGDAAGAVGLVGDVRAQVTHQIQALRGQITELRDEAEMNPTQSDDPVVGRVALARASDTVDRSHVRVLVADDEPAVRRVLAALLDDHGFDVVGEAVDGAQAIDLVHQLHPDVLVMDMKMPGKNGTDAARLIGARGVPTQVVLLSGAGRAESRTPSHGEGVFEVVTKGGPVTALCAIIDRASLAAGRGAGIVRPERAVDTGGTPTTGFAPAEQNACPGPRIAGRRRGRTA